MQVRKTYEQLHAEERFVIAREVLQRAGSARLNTQRPEISGLAAV